MSENEKFYDEEIAPALMLLAKKCEARGIPFLASVEYDPGKRGRTAFVPDHAGLAMFMLNRCALRGENVDGYAIDILRHARENNIPFESSMVMNFMDHGSLAPKSQPE